MRTVQDMLSEPGCKFGVLALPKMRALVQAPESEVEEGLHFCTHLPVGVPEHWQGWIGSLDMGELKETKCFLVVTRPSTQPSVTSQEDESIRDTLTRLHLGLLIATPYVWHGRPILVGGGNQSGEPQLRRYNRYPAVHHTLGSAEAKIDTQTLRSAANIARALETLLRNPSVERLPRILGAFRTACQSRFYDVRLHQFVRTAEGFLDSNRAGQFQHRANTMTDINFSREYREIYKARSSIEHLRGPLPRLSGKDDNERHRILVIRTLQAEVLARYCLWTFLSTPSLWPFFANDDSIGRFWSTLSDKQRAALWGNKLGMKATMRDLSPSLHRAFEAKGIA